MTSDAGKSAPDTNAKVAGAYGKLPLSFEANMGQADRRVRFVARGVGYGLFLTSNETVLTLRSGTSDSGELSPGTPSRESYKALRMKLVGAQSRSAIIGLDELPGKLNYFIGTDPRKWRKGVAAYSKVKYRDVYPGIDMVYHGSQGQLEYDFLIAPGRSPRRIKMAFKGMESITVDPDGTLVLGTAAGEVRQPKPIAYQDIDGERHEVAVRYDVRGNKVSFEVGAYNTNQTLIIDPVLIYSTFLGGTNGEQGLGIAVDAQGSAYLTGSTTSMDFPLAGEFQNTLDSFGDVFVVKLNPAGTALIYSTYLGGDSDEIGNAIAVDSQGSAYVVGATFSSTFPRTPGAFQDAKDGSTDSFVTKLSPSGSSLSYSTYLGGDHRDVAYGVSVSADGRAHVVGRTESTRFRTLPFPTPRNGSPAYKSTNGAVQWVPSSSGLTSSVVNGIGLDPSTANTLYAATNNGVFKSTNAAASWSLTGTGSPSTAPQSTNVVVIDPSNPNVIYAAGAFSGVYKSVDGGNSYAARNTGFQVPFVNALAIDPITPATLYAGTAFGMYKTTNGGDSWVDVSNGFHTTPRVNEVVIDPTNPAIVYVGTNSGMFKTTNGGALWTPDSSGVLSFTPITALTIDPLNPSTLYAGGFFGIFKTTDGGATWTSSSTGVPATAINALAIDPLTPTTLYAATTGSGIFKSTNGGANWTQSNTGLVNATINAVAVVGSNPAILYVGAVIGGDAFAVKFGPSGSTLEYLFNFGGNENDEARGVALDADGNAYLVGSTNSENFPVLNAFQSAVGGLSDAFVAKVNSSGTGFTYSTYLGGNGSEQGRGIAVRSGSAHVVGQTTSSNFPLVNPIKPTLAQFDTDAFVTKLNPAGNGADFSTFLGGSNTDQGFGVAVDTGGSVYVTGATRSSDFPTLAGPQPTFAGGTLDAFVTRLDAAGTSLIYSTYLGGTSTDQGNGIATDSLGNTYVIGVTSSNNFPTANPFQSTLKNVDAFVTKLGPGVELAVTMTDLPDPVAFGSDLTYTINVRNNGELPATNVTVTDTLPAGATVVSTASTRGTCSGTGPITCAIGTLNSGEATTVTIVIKPPAVRSITNTATVSLTESDPVPSNNTATTDTLVDFANLSIVKKAPHTLVAPGANMTYTLNVKNLGGIAATPVTVSDNLPAGTALVGCAATGGGVCGGAGNNVSVTFPSLAVGASEAITITVNVSSAVTAGTVIANTANASATLVDPDPQNNTSTASVTVTATPIVQRSNGLIAFAADRAFTPVSGPSGIYTINPDGTGESLFPNIPLNAFRPSWSPDGRRLAFQHRNGSLNEISVINADGSGLLKIAENVSSFNQRITWSPGGAHIAFIGEGDGQHVETFRVVSFANTDCGGTYRLPTSPTLLTAVDWSPDGSKFVYATDRELFVMNADGSGQTQVTTMQQTPDGLTTDSYPRWSPDGSKILFTRSTNNNRDLYSINSDGSGFTRLLNINQAEQGSWSPDGTKVVFVQANEIYTIDAVGAQQRLTNNIYYEFSPDWQPMDTQEIGRGVAVGVGDWEQQLEANKQSFINDFVLSQEFTRIFPLSMAPSQFVDILNANTGRALTAAERDALVADLTSGTKTRAQVVRAVAENPEFGRRQFNRAFVIMQYFGYLRRKPDEPPDSDFAGWQFWLNKLDQFNGNFVEAEMVKAFITCGEHTHRFGR
ncbi:MAG: SBBP repeat-containing protein [Pyrinomonadaceae bacterium]